MSRVDRLRTVFVADIPEKLEDGILYVSRECHVALHNCACGCGEEASTPLVPTEYALTMTGNDASIWPSIGNHDFACRSHYIIDHGRIEWSGRMSRAAIEAGRQKDRLLKRPPVEPAPVRRRRRFIGRLADWFAATFRRIIGR